LKIAVIGAGISGLTAAWHLSDHAEVVVYEANGYAGGHTDTHTLNVDGRTITVDSGFIVFNEDNYPNFTHMLRQLDVDWELSDMSFSAVNERTGMEYGAEGFRRLLAQRKNLLNPAFYTMLWDLARFYRNAPDYLKIRDDALTLGDFLRANKYSQSFVENHIVPMACALWSASAETIEKFPLHYFLAFMNNHRMLQVNGRPQWKVIKGGSSQYVKKILQHLYQRHSFRMPAVATSGRGPVRLSTPVTGVTRNSKGVSIQSDRFGVEDYDVVVFACHSDQALAILQDATAEEQQVLAAIPYQENHIVLHSDTSVMPANKDAWASWNARIPKHSSDQCHVSYWMNCLQNIEGDTPFIVSLNCKQRIDPKKIWAERVYQHPVYNAASIAAQRSRQQINGIKHSWYCGAYWGWGFHEDGVKSALAVVAGINKQAGSKLRGSFSRQDTLKSAVGQLEDVDHAAP